MRGAFCRGCRSDQTGERLAYLNRHGADGGVPVGVITEAQERSDGLWFTGDYLDVPETPQARSQVQSGINGVSVEFVPGKFRRKATLLSIMQASGLQQSQAVMRQPIGRRELHLGAWHEPQKGKAGCLILPLLRSQSDATALRLRLPQCVLLRRLKIARLMTAETSDIETLNA